MSTVFFVFVLLFVFVWYFFFIPEAFFLLFLKTNFNCANSLLLPSVSFMR